jgi:MFS family permease
MPFEEPESHVLELPAPLAEHKRRRGMFFLAVACVGIGMAFSLQLGLNDNFVVGEIGVDGFHKGLLECLRESCGIFALGVLALLAGLAEPLIGFAMLIVVGLGLGAMAGVHNFFWLAVMSMVWSQGLHVWMPLPNSMMLSLAEKGRTGHRLGQLQAAGAAGGVVILVLLLVLTYFTVPIRPLYLIGGGAAVLGGVACLFIPRDIKAPGPRFIMRRRYSLYYLLCFLEGWRKQIFLAFAGFLLVHDYGMKLTTMLELWLAGQVAVWLLSPLAGRLIDRLGERAVLTVYYLLLIGVFCGYAFISTAAVLCVLFVADNVLFTLNMALTTYVRRLAPPSEHTPTLSMGVAMNHVAAVTMPLAGGLIWKFAGYKWTFGIGMAAAALSIVAVSFLPRREERPPVTVANQGGGTL